MCAKQMKFGDEKEKNNIPFKHSEMFGRLMHIG